MSKPIKPLILRTKQELINYRTTLDSSVSTESNVESSTRLSTKLISIGFVPTMGALHQGHASLIRASIENNTHTIVSIFVNPTQFAPSEDFSSYPRTFEADYALCAELGVSAVFVPDASEMYNTSDEIGIVPPKSMGYVLEGFSRPTHFAGVLQIVLKLFMLARPHNAYFGKKDAQQLLIITKMVRDLCLSVRVIGCPIVRDDDGLALSSRNIYLSPADRTNALSLHRALESMRAAYTQGQRDSTRLKAVGLEALQNIQVAYVEIIDENLMPITDLATTQGAKIIVLAGVVGGVRLLDNMWL